MISGSRQPAIYLPHGAGPCFFMPWTPPHEWDGLRAWLQTLPQRLPATPRAILCITAHWEAPAFTVSAAAAPSLLYDYHGFPEHTYQLRWPVRGAPAVAERAAQLLRQAGLEVAVDLRRGYDHGTFIPLMVAWPQADVPVVQVSLQAKLDPLQHVRAGEALAALRDEGILIIGSGMSWHNMAHYNNPAARTPSERFDAWLTEVMSEADAGRRARLLARWQAAPDALFAHPRAEHLLPAMVVAGAGGNTPGYKDYSDVLMGVRISAFAFGELSAVRTGTA